MIDSQEAVTIEIVGTAPAPTPEPPAAEASAPPQRAPAANGIFDLKSLLSISVIVVFIITFVAQAFRVPSGSMENTLLTGDFLLADKVRFADAGGAWNGILPYRDIRRGDIVVFRYPFNPSIYFVKRVVGLPGDHIYLRDKTVYLNGKPDSEDYAIHRLHDSDFYRDNFPAGEDARDADSAWRRQLPRFVHEGKIEVPAGSYFVMGDNRDQSSDSRYWGFVPRQNILARPLVIYLSLRRRGNGEASGSGDTLFPSGLVLAHFFQLARWGRVFRVVR